MKDNTLSQSEKIKAGYIRLIINSSCVFLLLVTCAIGLHLFSFAHPKAFNSKAVSTLISAFIFICTSHLAILWVVKIRSGFIKRFLSKVENLDQALSVSIGFFSSILFFVIFDGLGGSVCYVFGAPLFVLEAFWFFALVVSFLLFPSYQLWVSWFEQYPFED